MCIRDRYYNAVNLFKTKETAAIWDICNMYPGVSPSEIAEIVATFFNKISLEYQPLPNPGRPCPVEPVQYILPHEVSARLRSFKKPRSQVSGDINPDLVTKFHDILAVPLTYIFNMTLNTLVWPDLWKAETVTVIPKNNSPADLSELRNLSCTCLLYTSDAADE